MDDYPPATNEKRTRATVSHAMPIGAAAVVVWQ